MLPHEEKRAVYACMIPQQLLDTFHIRPNFLDAQDRDLLTIASEPGHTTMEIALFPFAGARDPLLYGQLSDTLNGQIHILYYAINDPASPRFDVDRLADGSDAAEGTRGRNLDAEAAAMQAGLAPSQVRRGLRMLGECLACFEDFVKYLGHELFFAEPLHYHNAVVFERHGLTYQQGRSLMERIHAGFLPGGDLLPHLDGSTPFRMPGAEKSLRLRSWAIHDGILGEPFCNVTMYRIVGERASAHTCTGETCPEMTW